MAKKTAKQTTGTSATLTNFKLPDYDNLGLEKVEKREWREALEVGEQASTLIVACNVDCVKCNFKVTSHFTTIQFHSHDKRARLAMLQKKASMEMAAGEWGHERAAHYSELRQVRDNPQQLTIGSAIPNQANGEEDSIGEQPMET